MIPVDLMKAVTLLIGLLRSTARFSTSKSHPLISQIYPPPIGLDFNDINGSNDSERKPTTFRLNTDSSNWFWESGDCSTVHDGGSARISSGKSNVRIYSRHGSSFMNGRNERASVTFSLCFDEIQRVHQCVSSRY